MENVKILDTVCDCMATRLETLKIMGLEKFELGKCYRHSGGSEMHIVGVIDSIMWGTGFVAEEGDGQTLKPVSMNSKDSAVGWFEITREEFMKNYS